MSRLSAAGLDPKTPWMGTLDKSISEKDVDISHCLVVLSKTPDEIKQVLKATLEKVVKDPEFLADLKKWNSCSIMWMATSSCKRSDLRE